MKLWAATEARSLGRGGVNAVAKAAGLSRTTVHAGLSEIKAAQKAAGKRCGKALTAPVPTQRMRAIGGGRKGVTDLDESLLADLDALVEPTSREIGRAHV